MTLRHMKIFSAVYNQRSFTAAAEQLDMTQPAVSIAIKEMEEHYRAEFFIRTKKQLGITADAQKMIVFANRILRQMDNAEKAFLTGRDTAVLRSGFSGMSLKAFPLDRLFEKLQAEKDVRISYYINSSANIEKALLQGDIDFGLSGLLSCSTEIISLPLSEQQTVLLASPDYASSLKKPINPANLFTRPLLLPEKGNSIRESFDAAMGEKGFNIVPLIESSEPGILTDACIHGAGITALPVSLAEEYLSSGELVRVECKNLKLFQTLYFIIRSDTALTPELKAVIQELSFLFPDSPFSNYYGRVTC